MNEDDKNLFDVFSPVRRDINQDKRNDLGAKCWVGAIKLRDGFKCRKCGSDQVLQAHHIMPVEEDPDLTYDINNGITLCRKCHYDFHAAYGQNNIGHYEIYKFLRDL